MFEGIFQPMHLLVILFIAILVFGPKKLSELGKGLGEGIRGFKDAIREQPTNSAQSTTSAPAVAATTSTAPADKDLPEIKSRG